MKDRPPIGSCWRILVKQPQIGAASGKYAALAKGELEFEEGNIFDELVIMFDPDPHEAGPPCTQQNATCLHLEQMYERNWYLGIGDLKFNLHVKEETRAVEVTLYNGERSKFIDGRSG